MLRSLLNNKPEKCSSLYISENIPQKKIKKALKNYGFAITNEEDVIALFDDTVFGGASEGFIITKDYLISSYHRFIFYFHSIKSISSDGKSLIIDNFKISPAQISSIDLIWLSTVLNKYKDNISPLNLMLNKLTKYCENKSNISLRSLILDNIQLSDKVFNNINIPEKVLTYFKSLFKVDDNDEYMVNTDEIILLIYDNTYNSVRLDAFIFLTDELIAFKNNDEFIHIFPLQSIKDVNIEGDNIKLEFLDSSIIYTPMLYIVEDALNLFSLLKYYINKFNSFDDTIEYDVFEKHFNKNINEDYINEDEETKHKNYELPFKYKLLYNPSSILTDPLFKVISMLDGKSIIIVAFLRNNAPERVLNILMNIPGINIAAGTTKIILGKALNWLNNMIMKHGESYIMEKLINNFKKRDIKKDKLKKDIDSDIYTILGDDIVGISLELLDKYMQDDNEEEYIDSPDKNDMNNNSNHQICHECGSQNKNDAKFCSNCGAKLLKEYKCNKCGYSQQDAMKFCPECGNPI